MGCGSSTAVSDTADTKEELKLQPVEPAPVVPLVGLRIPRSNSESSQSSDWGQLGSPAGSATSALAPQDVDAWLRAIGMMEYALPFRGAGFVELSAVAKMTEADLDTAGVTKAGHRKKFQKQCDKLGELMQRNIVIPGAGKIELGVADHSGLAPKIFLRSDDHVPSTLRQLTHAGTALAPQDVDAWLRAIGMMEYALPFRGAGFVELSAVAKMTEADLDTAGVTKAGHRKKFQKQCDKLGELMQRNIVIPGAGKIELGVADHSGLAPKIFLRSDDHVPSTLRQLTHAGTRARVYKGVHAANLPCEDRHTVVQGDGFIFAGVWDGHTGHSCSEFAEEQIFVNFKRAADAVDEDVTEDDNIERAFRTAYTVTDKSYNQVTKRQVKQKEKKAISLFAGTCAVGAHIDLAARKVSVANLGDSRAVIGLYEPTGLRTVIMSHDQTASDDAEIVRLKRDHAADRTILINKGDQATPDWRVKGICQFTRSIGDLQMKDKAVAMLYNHYTKGSKVQPMPGIKSGNTATKPYIIHHPEFKEQTVGRGFLLIACDGLWDEMSNEEAVHTVAELLRDYPEPEADIAGMLIDRALQMAAQRIVEDYPELAPQVFADPMAPTVAELKALPQGKKMPTHRSNLHDDITVVIIVLEPDEIASDLPAVMLKSASGHDLVSQNKKHRKKPQETSTEFTTIASSEEEDIRMRQDAMILELIDVASSFSADQLRILFDALDTNPRNGLLSVEECGQLCHQVLGEEGNSELADMVFMQMDVDNTRDVSFENFLNFFQGKNSPTAPDFRQEDPQMGC